MMDCKSMATPMVTNLKKLRDSDSDLVDPSMYRQLIGSLMYLVNTRPGHLLCCEHIEPVLGGTKT
jgi:hypothetical protein